MLITAALLEPYTVVPGTPRCTLIEAFSTIAEPLGINADCFLDSKEDALRIDIHGFIKQLFGNLFEGNKLHDAGVNEQGINASKAFADFLDYPSISATLPASDSMARVPSPNFFGDSLQTLLVPSSDCDPRPPPFQRSG